MKPVLAIECLGQIFANVVQRCGARGRCSDINTTVPSIALSQCGVPSGTMMKSPFATRRDIPPSMPLLTGH